jgi:hypothetical protein
MGVTIFQMKTQVLDDVTDQFDNLNDCIVHHCKPLILKIMSGGNKNIDYVAVCESNDCYKISESAEKTVEYWNKWNPKPNNIL